MGRRARAARSLGLSVILGPAEGAYGEAEEKKAGAAREKDTVWTKAASLKAAILELWRQK
jgi:hypothetical protein